MCEWSSLHKMLYEIEDEIKDLNNKIKFDWWQCEIWKGSQTSRAIFTKEKKSRRAESSFETTGRTNDNVTQVEVSLNDDGMMWGKQSRSTMSNMCGLKWNLSVMKSIIERRDG